MKTAYFDCPFGASGNMLLGAMVAAMNEFERSLWLREIDKIALPKDSFQVEVSDTIRSSISSKYVDVLARIENEERHLSEIVDIINNSLISDAAKQLSKRIFASLAVAESKVHGVGIEQVHFHEVGAVDAIVDIIGFAIAYDLLKIDQAIVSDLPLGSGCVKTEHGLLPIPGPAVLYLLSEAKAPIKQSDIPFECLTPTGAAILITIASAWGLIPALSEIHSIGYGAGTYNPEGWPNVSRIIIGEGVASPEEAIEELSSRFASEEIAVIEANLDDISPQVLAYAADRLMDAGALDVYITPCIMKKGRNGSLLSVVCRPADQKIMQELILTETSSLGARAYICRRAVADRQWHNVVMGSGDEIRVKVAVDKFGQYVNAQPEYEDCAAYAKKQGQPLKQVLNEAIGAFRVKGD